MWITQSYTSLILEDDGNEYDGKSNQNDQSDQDFNFHVPPVEYGGLFLDYK